MRPGKRKHYKKKGLDFRLKCPNCYTVESDDITRLRAEYYWCRRCGYENDIDMWERNEKRKYYHKYEKED